MARFSNFTVLQHLMTEELVKHETKDKILNFTSAE
jgi:hypothetical protein